MGKLLSMLGALILYLSFGTILAECAAIGYLWSSGYLSPEKLTEIDSVMRDFTPSDVKAAAKAQREAPLPSVDQVARARALSQRDLELREQTLRQRTEQMKVDQAKLRDELARYNQMKAGFANELAQLHDATAEASSEQARVVLENLKSKQAKDQLVRMIEAGEMEAAVKLFAAMSVSKRAKISGEFKSEDEAKKLAEILKRIREGEPDLPVIDATKNRLQDQASGS